MIEQKWRESLSERKYPTVNFFRGQDEEGFIRGYVKDQRLSFKGFDENRLNAKLQAELDSMCEVLAPAASKGGLIKLRIIPAEEQDKILAKAREIANP